MTIREIPLSWKMNESFTSLAVFCALNTSYRNWKTWFEQSGTCSFQWYQIHDETTCFEIKQIRNNTFKGDLREKLRSYSRVAYGVWNVFLSAFWKYVDQFSIQPHSTSAPPQRMLYQVMFSFSGIKVLVISSHMAGSHSIVL